MTNAVRNMASAMITEFGGAVAVPSAVRRSESTTTIRVNDVIMIRIEGAIDSTVKSAISWMARSVTPPLPWPKLMLMSCASAGAASVPAAIRVARNKTLRGEVASLTKGSLVVRAGTPSRLQDSQIQSSPAVSARPQEARAARRARQGARQAVRGRRAGQPDHRPAGEAPLQAAAPFQQDFGRPPISAELVLLGARAARARARRRCETPACPLRG